MAVTLQQLQNLCQHLVNQFRDEQFNITPMLDRYRVLLHNYVNDLVFDKEQRAFLLEDFLEESCTALMKRTHIHYRRDYNNADHIASCCKLLVAIAVPLIQDDHRLAMHIIYYCLNPEGPFFRTFGTDWVCKSVTSAECGCVICNL